MACIVTESYEFHNILLRMEDCRLDKVIAELKAPLQIQVAHLEAEVNRRENKREP
jgi:hypothetical protein